MIVVATDDFEVYHGVVNELRDRGVVFTTIEPDDDLPERTSVVVAADGEEPPVPDETPLVRADPDDARRAVDEVLALLRGGGGRTVVGVDPGDRPGIAVLSGETVVAVFTVPLADAADVVREEVAEAVDPLVRVGDGARGMGDVLAAVNIARLEGERVDSRTIEPTPGELKRIKDRSRQQSDTNRAIDEQLARRVAAGEITVEEALAEHAGTADADGSDGS
ncbi:hypothetical protein BRC64_10320 [Halobacteriales archaeon QH_10_67_22]|nr:MAG: hypothetical protein BRC64_10320 [Halobacteriales archaeon QH_10_67_22]